MASFQKLFPPDFYAWWKLTERKFSEVTVNNTFTWHTKTSLHEIYNTNSYIVWINIILENM